MRRKQAKFIEHGGTARVIAIAIARVLLPVLCFLGAFGRAMFVPIQVWAHQQAFATTTLRGMGMEILTGFATAPSTTFTALTMATGDSLQVRNSNPAKNVWLLGMWAQNQVAGSFRVHSPKLHDNVQGIRIRNNTGDTLPLFPRGIKQLLYPQDVLVAEITGSAVGGKIEQGSLLMYYEDLPGSTARLITPADVQKGGVNIFPVQCSITAGSAGGYSGSQAINATVDLFKANTDYALIGYHVSAACTSVGIKGPDVSGMRVGGPGDPTFSELTGDFFRWASDYTGLPMIPVINSANKAGTFIDVAQNDGGAAVVVDLIFVELAKGSVNI
jgi:hypothetical protein